MNESSEIMQRKYLSQFHTNVVMWLSGKHFLIQDIIVLSVVDMFLEIC
jgi:hypothetical protein